MAKNMNQISRSMVLNRVTKGAARFTEELAEGEPEVLGGIYIKRWALGSMLKDIPKGDVEDSDLKVKVTIEF